MKLRQLGVYLGFGIRSSAGAGPPPVSQARIVRTGEKRITRTGNIRIVR